MTDTPQESKWKRWLTSWQAAAAGLGTVAAAILAWINLGDRIWRDKPTSYELTIVKLKSPTTYKANLYDLDCKDAEGGAWVGTARLVDTGYVARVQLSVRVIGDAYPEDCRISADTGPIWWSWKPLNPPECGPETAGECTRIAGLAQTPSR